MFHNIDVVLCMCTIYHILDIQGFCYIVELDFCNASINLSLPMEPFET